MRRICMRFCLVLSLALALGYTWILGAPGILGQVGPCSVTVYAPSGPIAADYEYLLVGAGLQKSLFLRYDPAQPDSATGIFQNLPPGNYRILGLGLTDATVEVTSELPAAAVHANVSRPIFSPDRKKPPSLLLYFCM